MAEVEQLPHARQLQRISIMRSWARVGRYLRRILCNNCSFDVDGGAYAHKCHTRAQKARGGAGEGGYMTCASALGCVWMTAGEEEERNA